MEIKEQHLVQSRFNFTRLVLHRNQWQPVVRAGPIWRPHQEADIVRLEPNELRSDYLVGTTRNGGVAWRHVDLIRAGRLDAAHRREKRRDTMPQVCRPKNEEEYGGDAGRHEQRRRHLQLLLLDCAAHVDVSDF